MHLIDRTIRFLPTVLGMGLHLVIFARTGADLSVFSVVFLLWCWLPYGLCLSAAFALRSPWPSFFAAAFVLVNDLIAFDAVFIHPKSSTAAIGLLFTPLFNLGLAPLGLLAGWAVSRLFRSPVLP